MNHKQKIWLITLLMVVLVFTADTVMAHTFAGIFLRGQKPGRLVFYSLMIVALFTTLAIHELGHLVAGLAQGFRFQLYIVGLLGLRRSGKKIDVFLNKDLGMMGGVAATVPVTHDPRNKQKFARIVLAGPIASLLFAVIACVLWMLVSSGAARGFWFTSVACSAAIFLATTVPKKTGVFFTDRARYQRLAGNDAASRSEEAMLTLMAQYFIDNSYKNISLENARIMQADNEAFTRFWGHYYEYNYYKDNAMNDEAETAREKLRKLKEQAPAALKNFIKKADPDLAI